MGAQRDAESWEGKLARITAQLDDLRARSDEEYRVLHSELDRQIADLRATLHRLEARVEAMQPDAYAKRVAEQIEELKAKGDAAYERLQSNVPGALEEPH